MATLEMKTQLKVGDPWGQEVENFEEEESLVSEKMRRHLTWRGSTERVLGDSMENNY